MKKILVRAPDSEEDVVLSFPFFYALKEEYPQAQINVISMDNCKELFSFLPFSLNVFSFSKNMNTIPGIHHYAFNLNDVFNIDIYFDLIDDFHSAFMGFAFQAKHRLGADQGLKKYLRTKRLPQRNYSSVLDRGIALFTQQTARDFPSKKIAGGETSLLKGALDPYLLFLIDEMKLDENKRKLLQIFINSFENQKIIFWNYAIDSDYDELESRKAFFASLVENNSSNNKFEFLNSSNYTHLVQLVLASKGVFCDCAWKVRIATYLGLDAYYWGKNVLASAAYFKFDPHSLILNSEKIALSFHQEEIKFETIESLVDYLHKELVL